MKRSMSFGVFAILISGLFMWVSVSAAAENISGTVVNEKSEPIQGIRVFFHDAINAKVFTAAETNISGVYDSGSIPTGDYRVRFADLGAAKGPYLSEFFGAGGVDDFCLAATVSVVLGSTTTVNESMRSTEPSEVVEWPFEISGMIVDDATFAPLQGIEVSVLRAGNAQSTAVATTDSNGRYSIRGSQFGYAFIRVRFLDPAGRYFPEFFGAEHRDAFCSSTIISLAPERLEVSASLRPIPPEQLTGELTQTIDGLGLPNNVSTMLSGPLIRAVDLLTDGNTSNDAGVCAQLTSFITRVTIQENHGQLSAADAENLRQSAENIKVQLGCS